MEELIGFIVSGFGLIFLILSQLRELLRQYCLFMEEWEKAQLARKTLSSPSATVVDESAVAEESAALPSDSAEEPALPPGSAGEASDPTDLGAGSPEADLGDDQPGSTS
ncbi:hypothetical protein [Kineosporia succinea]|uniref:Uncharacterized protein n=1 Tax=Kineosporia succinea TaxID=84632 RepID=A0ABT9NZ07_9ACTN|nr:hypothetical protein [Kineosporia succinea]MDP9825195.1 hypothetical protein [Kineosporia succinea]